MAARISELVPCLTPDERLLVERVRAAMEGYFGADAKRITHADAVAGYALELLAFIDADPVLTMTVAYLHDIGIHEAERRHGSNAGSYQELEGPPVARQLLEVLEVDAGLIERATRIIGRHHTPGGVDAAEFRILWDADALVNFAEVFPGKPAAEIESLLRRHMVTEPGLRFARRLFLPSAQGSAKVDPREDFPG